ncbi:MAG: 2-keto-4-pentenoate hydratase [Planctomycetota bacterium]|jgi:2-keto-4-pentenoate hydratase
MKDVYVTRRRPLLLVLVLAAGSTLAAGNADTEAMIPQMVGAWKTHTQIAPLSATYGAFSMDRGYRIQQVLAKEVTSVLGPVAGYKVAYASKAAQKQFSMTEPARGPFYMLQRVPAGSVLPASAFNEIMLETEVAFSIGKRIDKPIPNVAALREYVKYVYAAFDASDFPYAPGDAKPTPPDMVAMGTGAHIFVLGPAMDPAAVDVGELSLALMRNGRTIREKPARDVMGSPWNSLLWCANHVAKYGDTLEPGMVILTGTAAAAYRVRGDEIKGTYVADCGALGRVTMTIK